MATAAGMILGLAIFSLGFWLGTLAAGDRRPMIDGED